MTGKVSGNQNVSESQFTQETSDSVNATLIKHSKPQENSSQVTKSSQVETVNLKNTISHSELNQQNVEKTKVISTGYESKKLLDEYKGGGKLINPEQGTSLVDENEFGGNKTLYLNNDQSRNQFKMEISGQQVKLNGKEMDTSQGDGLTIGAEKGQFIFVMDKTGNMFAADMSDKFKYNLTEGIKVEGTKGIPEGTITRKELVALVQHPEVELVKDSKPPKLKVIEPNGSLFNKGQEISPEEFETSKASLTQLSQEFDKLGPNKVKEERFHHSTFLGGDDVGGAGTINVQDGKITSLTDASGHYKPEVKQVGNVIEQLQKQKVQTEAINIHLIEKGDTKSINASALRVQANVQSKVENIQQTMLDENAGMDKVRSQFMEKRFEMILNSKDPTVVKHEIGQLKEQVVENESKISRNKTNITGLKSDISNINDQIEQMVDALKSMPDLADNLKAEINKGIEDCKESINNIKVCISNMEAQNTQLESNNNKLAAQSLKLTEKPEPPKKQQENPQPLNSTIKKANPNTKVNIRQPQQSVNSGYASKLETNNPKKTQKTVNSGYASRLETGNPKRPQQPVNSGYASKLDTSNPKKTQKPVNSGYASKLDTSNPKKTQKPVNTGYASELDTSKPKLKPFDP